MTLDQIKKKLELLKPDLHKQFGVSEIGVFGSFVRGEQRDNSDIDILVSFDRLVTLFQIVELEFFLEEIFGRKVEVAIKDELKHHIGQIILNEVQLV